MDDPVAMYERRTMLSVSKNSRQRNPPPRRGETMSATPAKRVRAVFPEAHCYQWAGPTYCIYPGTVKIKRGKRKPWLVNNSIGIGGHSVREAWANAARGLKRYPWKV